MKNSKSHRARYKVSSAEAIKLIVRHARKRIVEQLKSVSLIIVYMVLFQVLVLEIPLFDSALIAGGFVMVVFGLAFFMEGLLLGLMPLGEVIGLRLPMKVGISVILLIAFILGIGATFAEPAIGALRLAGQSVMAWSSPLLFLMLNKFSNYLVYAISVGVGFAMIFGMLRFLYGWSLKPFIYISVPVLLAVSFYAYLDPNLVRLMGLAWDCGGITTGPVTVPLILAMGIGISHVSKRSGSNTGAGFGVVTLASLFPVLTVIITGAVININIQAPSSEQEFFSLKNKTNALALFHNEDELKGYAISHSSPQYYMPLFENDVARLDEYHARLLEDSALRKEVFGSEAGFEKWLLSQRNYQLKLDWYGSPQKVEAAETNLSKNGVGDFDVWAQLKRHSRNAVQAILPLSFFLILVMFIILREKLPRADEIFLGLFFALIGMAIFNGGIELGLAKIGDQVGANLPSSYTSIPMQSERITIKGFHDDIVNQAIDAQGSSQAFFYYKHKGKYSQIPFEPQNYDAERKHYSYTPSRGPLFGSGDRNLAGLLVVLLFSFVMGYGATLAEPALNALGMAVEDISVGTFKKSLLIQAVAVGVGIGIAFGMAKIIWDLPLFWMLAIPYALLLVITYFSTEDYVNIGWDSAGVTTGPITVPLVLALGLGVGSQLGVVEGFGILSMASACPIISVLSVGLYVNFKRKAVLNALGAPDEEPGIIPEVSQ